jgi:hypothetical protein
MQAMTGTIDALTFSPALIAIFIIVVALNVRRIAPKRDPELGRRVGRAVGIASAFEGVAVPVAAVSLGSIGRYDLVMPAIAGIVALHFLPIAWAAHHVPYYVVAALMMALAAGSLLLPPAAVRTMVVGFGSGALLWILCGLTLARTARQSAAA